MDIWTRIKKIAPMQSQWKKKIPTQWIEAERFLQVLGKDEPVITYGQMCVSVDVPDLQDFIKYMESSGLILTTKIADLESDDEMVINPQWLINAFRQVIDFDIYHKSGYGDVRKISNGELTNRAAKEVWSQQEFKKYIPTLLFFMENLGLIARPLDETKFYYIPSLLKPMDDSTINENIYKIGRLASRTFVLDFRHRDIQVPFPHFDKIIAEIISKESRSTLVRAARNGCIVMMRDEPLGYAVCYGCSIIKLTMFTKKSKEQAEKRLRNGYAGKSLIEKILRISDKIASRFCQRVNKEPIRGISCNPFPPTGKTPIEYAKIDDLMTQYDTTMFCCRYDHTLCKTVERTDLDDWGCGKKDL